MTIPAGQPATLRYWYQTDSEDLCGYDHGYVQLTVDGATTVVQCLNLCSAAVGEWQTALLDLSAYAGKMVTVSFLATTDYWLRSSFFVDDVALLSGDGCPVGQPPPPLVADAATTAANSGARMLIDPVAPAVYAR